MDSYDPMLTFRNHVELTSTLKPSYIFTWGLAEVLFSAPGRVSFSPKNHGSWDPEAKVMEIWGDPKIKWYWTSEADAAEFTAAILDRPEAAEGGFWHVRSGAHSSGGDGEDLC